MRNFKRYVAVWKVKGEPTQVSYFERKNNKGVLRGLKGFETHLKSVYGSNLEKYKVVSHRQVSPKVKKTIKYVVGK